MSKKIFVVMLILAGAEWICLLASQLIHVLFTPFMLMLVCLSNIVVTILYSLIIIYMAKYLLENEKITKRMSIIITALRLIVMATSLAGISDLVSGVMNV